MKPLRIAITALLVAAAGAGAGSARSPLAAMDFDRGTVFRRPIETIVPGRGAMPVRLHGGGGPIDRYAPDRTAGYALIALPLRPDVPSLVLLDHDARARIRARVLDRAPWDDPAVVLPVALERWRGDRGGRRVADAWLVLPDGEPPQDVVLLVELSSGPLRVGLFDPSVSSRYESFPDRPERGASAGLPSPIEADGWRNVQRLWPWPASGPAAR